MKLAAFILTTLLTPLLAEAQECHLQQDDESIRSCLNSHAKSILANDAPIGVRDRYLTELSQVLERSGITQFDLSRTQSLDQAFTLEVPAIKDILDTQNTPCFSFADGKIKNLTEGGKEYLVQTVQSQMKEAAYFLKTAHAWSLGNASSQLFQIRRVEICTDGKKSATFNKGTLRLNVALKLTGAKTFTAKEIFTEWNNGNIVFGPEIGFVKEKIAGVKRDLGTVISAKLRPAWMVLNPLSDVRYQLRMALYKKSGESAKSLLESHLTQKSIEEKSSELGLAPVALTEDEAVNVAGHFVNRLQDSQFLNQALEQILVATNGGSHSVEVVDNRVNIGLVAVKNNKQISINVANLFPAPLEMTEELKEAQAASADQVTAQLNGKNIGLVAVDLFDQVAVNVVPPNLMNLIEKISLKEALKKKTQRVTGSSSAQTPELISL